MPEKNDDVHDDHDEKNEKKVGDPAEDDGDHDEHDEGGDDWMKTTAILVKNTKLMKSSMIATAFSWEWKGAGKSYKKE